MSTETFPKSSGKSYDTVESPSGWNNGNTEKREYPGTGRNKYCVKAGSNYKVNVGKEAPGNTSRREYPKKGNSAQGGFGTGA